MPQERHHQVPSSVHCSNSYYSSAYASAPYTGIKCTLANEEVVGEDMETIFSLVGRGFDWFLEMRLRVGNGSRRYLRMSEMIFLTDLWTLHWVVFFCCAHDWPHVWLVVSVSAIRCKCTDKTTQEMTSWSWSLLLGYNRCDHTLVWIKHKLLDIVLFYVE